MAYHILTEDKKRLRKVTGSAEDLNTITPNLFTKHMTFKVFMKH